MGSWSGRKERICELGVIMHLYFQYVSMCMMNMLCVCVHVLMDAGQYISPHACGGQRTASSVNHLLPCLRCILLFSTVYGMLAGPRASGNSLSLPPTLLYIIEMCYVPYLDRLGFWVFKLRFACLSGKPFIRWAMSQSCLYIFTYSQLVVYLSPCFPIWPLCLSVLGKMPHFCGFNGICGTCLWCRSFLFPEY